MPKDNSFILNIKGDIILITTVVKGCPEETIEKRKSRITEALQIKFVDPQTPVKYIIDHLPNGTEVYFMKPGKEFFRDNPNLNDMLPCVGDLCTRFSFADIWELLCKLRNTLEIENYKKLSAILYRVAYLIDFDYIDGKVRFNPTQEILEEIEIIQRDADSKGIEVNILAFVHFMDILGWNDEMKTHANNDGLNYVKNKPKMGRINTILSCISIPLIFQEFVEEVIKNKDDKTKIDFTVLINVAQTFARSRGVCPLPNKDLVKLLSPYLVP